MVRVEQTSEQDDDRVEFHWTIIVIQVRNLLLIHNCKTPSDHEKVQNKYEEEKANDSRTNHPQRSKNTR